MSRVKSSGGREFGLMEELLRVLPDLGGVSSEGEPETDEVGLGKSKKGRKKGKEGGVSLRREKTKERNEENERRGELQRRST